MSDYGGISGQEFSRLCEFIYRRTGMVFTENKRAFAERRVADRIAATGAGSFASYFARLRSDFNGEIEQFVNAFTVNETYFLREDHQLRCLTDDLLATRVRHKKAGDALRIWSVPCSTGEEPYSIALWLLERWPLVDTYDIEIVGSDIDTAVLDQARDGYYGQRAISLLPPSWLERYFTPIDSETWRIVDSLRQSVSFNRVNIVAPDDTRPHGQFDVIFCRNVLIYFDDASRRVAAENLYENLLPGGYICLGHAESMSRISSLFEVCRFTDAIVYRRPEGPATAGKGEPHG